MNQARYKIATMCWVPGVSTSGYYQWQRREPSVRAQQDALLLARIRALHERSRGTYGVPRIHANEKVRPAADLVERDFTVEGPSRLWVADITYIRTSSGFLYLAVVVDAFSRRVVGWAMKRNLRTQLVLDALEMALGQRRPESVIHHSDQGTQYTSIAFGQRCRRASVRPSMGSVGDCYDNALCESFFASLECELLQRNRFLTPTEARSAVFDFIEGFYNPHRLHSSLGYYSPAEFERRYATLPAVPNQKLSTKAG